MPNKKIRTENADRKCLVCKDVYLKSSNSLNSKSLLNLLPGKNEIENHRRK